VQRLLYALSTPEYIEAWLTFPTVERIECHSEQRSFDRFRIDPFSLGKKLPSIYGSCLLSKPNRVTYLWDTGSLRRDSHSVVEILVLGGPAKYNLKLRHSGLADEDQRERYSLMWQASLDRFRTLIQRVEFDAL
jgi:hypothetical protein